MLIDDGVIEVEAERWHVLPDKLLAAHVPTTLTGVLQARLDALGARERTALQQGRGGRPRVLGPGTGGDRPRSRRGDPAAAAQAAGGASRRAGSTSRRVHVPAPPAAPGDLRRRAEGAAPARPRARRRILERARRSEEPAGRRRRRRAARSPRRTTIAACADAEGVRDLVRCPVLQLLQRLRDPDAATADAVGGRAVRAAPRARPCRDRAGADQPGAHGRVPARDRTWPSRRCAARSRSRSASSAPTISTRRGPSRCWAATSRAGATTPAAEPFFRRALEVRERLLGVEHPLTVGTLSDLAYVVKELDRLDEAENLSRRVLQVRERTAGPETPETAIALTALGEVLAKKGDASAAEPLFRRALAVQQQQLERRQSRHRPDDVASGRGPARARAAATRPRPWRGAPSRSGNAASGPTTNGPPGV